MVALVGVMVTVSNVPVLTARVVDPVTEPKTALIVVVPLPWPVAVAPLTDATAGLDDAHLASGVMFCVLPSLKLPVLVNCCVPPTAMVCAVGVTTREVRIASLTVRFVEVVMDPRVAVIVAVPTAGALANPSELTLTVLDDEELQVTEEVMFFVLPLL